MIETLCYSLNKIVWKQGHQLLNHKKKTILLIKIFMNYFLSKNILKKSCSVQKIFCSLLEVLCYINHVCMEMIFLWVYNNEIFYPVLYSRNSFHCPIKLGSLALELYLKLVFILRNPCRLLEFDSIRKNGVNFQV